MMQFDDIEKAIAFSIQNPEEIVELCSDPEQIDNLRETIDRLGFNCRFKETALGYEFEGWRKPIFGIPIEVEPSWTLLVADVPF